MRKVAIITRTKNRPILLKRAFESVKNQVYKDYLWVIVNDGGKNDPVEKIVLEANNTGIETLLIHNGVSNGMEAAANVGVRNSSSEYVVIHDDDDTWESEFLNNTVDYLESKDGEIYGGVVTHAYKVEEVLEGDNCTFKRKSIFKVFDKLLMEIYLSDIAKSNLFPNNSFLYRRNIFEKIGGYNEALPVLGDWDFNLKFLLNADIAVIPKPLANFHCRIQNNITEEYANTVVQGIDKHNQYDAILRNYLLRDDINNNKFGIGYLVNMERDNRTIITTITDSSLKEGIASAIAKDIANIIKKHGFCGVIKKLFTEKKQW